MPFYLTQARLSKDAIQALMARPRDRTEAVTKMLESAGGKLHTTSSPSASTTS